MFWEKNEEILVLLIAVKNEKLANLYTNEMVAHINECLREWHYLLVALAVRMELVKSTTYQKKHTVCKLRFWTGTGLEC